MQDNRIIWALIVFSIFFLGFQTAQPAAAVTKIDQFNVYHMGGQSSDADVFKTYSFNSNQLFISITGYNYNANQKKYVKNGFKTWMYVAKVSKTQLKIKVPEMDGGYENTYKYTTHTATNYYWHTLRYKLKNRLHY